ncbi:GstE2.2 family protein [Megaselia abdita]
MSKPILYGIDPSPPTRACLLTAKAIGLDFEYKVVNLMAGEHMTEEFLKKNPQHTVPLLEDNGEYIADSHAICTYLIQKYGKEKDQLLYPADLYQRALVDQKLHFDTGVLFTKLRAVMKYILPTPKKVPEELVTAVYEGFDFLETFLANSNYLVGNTMTVADICCIATVSSLVFAPINPVKYPKLTDWIKRMKQLPYYETNENGASILLSLVKPHCS